GPPEAAIGTLVAAGALAAAFVLFAALSEAEDQALASECGRDAGGFCSAERLSTLNGLNIAADVSWIAAAAAGAAGLVMLFVLPPDGTSEDAPLSVAPWATPTAAGASARGTF
nr:hypothetical protein [Myxococcota bacterium]